MEVFDSIKKQLQEQIEKIEKIDRKLLIGGIIGGVVGVTVLGIGAYYLFRKEKTPTLILEPKIPLSKSTNTAAESSQGDDLRDLGQRNLIRIVNSIKKLVPEDRGIDFEGLKAIYRAQYELSRNEFKALTTESRLKRRKVLKNLKEYNTLLSAYVSEVDAIHNKHLNALQAHFKIDQVQWVQLTEEAANQFGDEWDQFILNNDEEELNSMRDESKPKIKLQSLIQIEKFRVAQLQDKIETFKEVFKELDPTDLYELVEKWGRDIVYDKFKVEEEDILFSISQLTEEEKERLEIQQEEVRSTMENLIVEMEMGDEDEDEQEEEQK